MCPTIQDDLERLLDLAKQHGQSTYVYTGATYLFGALKNASSANSGSSRSSTPRRRTMAQTRRAHDLAKRAMVKASRNDRRRRLPERSTALSPEIHEHHEPDESSSDSDVPLSRYYGSTTQSSPTPSELPAPLSDDEIEPEVRSLDDYVGFEVVTLTYRCQYAKPEGA